MFSIKLQRMLKRLNPIRGIRWAAFWLSNWRRQRSKIDYITILLPAQMPLLPERRSWLRKRVLGAPPVSLVELDRLLERIGNDPRPKGVILHLRGLTLSLADLQTLRGSLLRLRAKGKRVICFALGYDNATYYLASAADEIVLQPGGELNTIGMRREATFLKDALARVGVELESVAISPYKGAFDQFTRNDISPEGREQLEWLLDSQFNQWVQGIAEGRKLSADAVRAMIDAAPYLDEEALQNGYVDAAETEESLFRRLKAEHWLTWEAADKKLLKKWRKSADKVVGLLRIEGLMVAGTSGKPPIELPIPFIGGERAGDLTVVAQVRELMNDDRVGAVIVYVDSGGGAADAAEAMTSALLELTGLLDESDKIDPDSSGKKEVHERFIRTVDKQTSGEWLKFDIPYAEYNYVYVAKNHRPFKSKGVYGYSHGGFTPQEIIIPKFRFTKQKAATSSLLISITNKQDLSDVSGEFFVVKLEASKSGVDLFAAQRKVQIRLYAGGNLYQSSSILNLDAGKTESVQLSFDKNTEVQAVLLDAETHEQIDKVTIKKSNLRDLGGL